MHTLSNLSEIKLFSLPNFLQIEQLIKSQKEKFKEFLPILFKSQKIRQIEAKRNHFVFPKVVFMLFRPGKLNLAKYVFLGWLFSIFALTIFKR